MKRTPTFQQHVHDDGHRANDSTILVDAAKCTEGAADDDDATHTSDEPDPPLGPPLLQPPSQRLVAPLQYRDPERYDVLGEHGRGGLGTVSRARDKELGRHVAIKELILRDDRGEIRFLREALITARLEHPGIVPIHEAGRWPDGTPFYVMKLVAGRSLKDLIAERTTVEDRIGLLHHVIAVADAMAYAHKRKIIHRDLKPANVVAGDFGETVVIDWGLAKDLSAADETGTEPAPYRVNAVDDLTATGSVLGTPMYMAPEQSRGEAVDQRADVFAIGAMLWELCSLQRVPPEDNRQRDRLLRRAGIDKDLAAIVAKSLSPSARHRYRDAGELASDLKAFKSGARIAARRYSLFAMLGHWAKRQRALAMTITIALMVSVGGGFVSVSNIAIERDRADAALVKAEEERKRARTEEERAVQASDELVLENAELLLGKDPTAAFRVLETYRGSDRVRYQRLVAEARGRGVAKTAFSPHSDTIWFLAADPSGDILSAGEDRKIQLKQGEFVKTLASDVSAVWGFAYAHARRRFAYASPTGVNILDIATGVTRSLDIGAPMAIEITPDGEYLATVDADALVRLWRLGAGDPSTDFRYRAPGLRQLSFAGSSRLLVGTADSVDLVTHDAGRMVSSRSAKVQYLSLDMYEDRIVIGDNRGFMIVLSRDLVKLDGLKVCLQSVSGLSIQADTGRVAFGCSERAFGVVTHSSTGLTVLDRFLTDGEPTLVRSDALGRRVFVSDDIGLIYVYDNTSRLVSRYEGMSNAVSSIAPPVGNGEVFLSGDVNGNVREWKLAPPSARAVINGPVSLHGPAFDLDAKTIVVGGADGIVRRVELSTNRVEELRGHKWFVYGARFAPDGATFLTYGMDATVRVWSAVDNRVVRIFAEHRNEINDAEYVDGGRLIVSSGDDGRLLLWGHDGRDFAVLLEHSRPLLTLEVLSRNNHVVVHDGAGAVWDVSMSGTVAQVRESGGAAIELVRTSRDGRLLATAADNGIVTVYDTDGWRAVKTFVVGGNIRQIAFDPNNRDLLVASENGSLFFVALSQPARAPWRVVSVMARDVAYDREGDIIGAVTNGATWFYSIENDEWRFVIDHQADTTAGRFSRDGTRFASVDQKGRLVVRDVLATFRTGGGRAQGDGGVPSPLR